MSDNSTLTIKDKIQRDALNKWFIKGSIGSIIMATGCGKSRLGVLASEYEAKISNYDCKILIITPTQEIRDSAWTDEFNKWDANLVYDQCVQIMCIQSAYKLIGHHFSLVICDEYHNYLKDYDVEEDSEYMKFFFNNTYDKLLALTAYLPFKKRYWGFKIAPLIESIDTKQAVELGLVSPFIIFNMPITISQEEQAVLSFIDERIAYMKEKNYAAWSLIGKRKMLLSKLKNRLEMAKQISDYFGNKRGILFSEYVEDVETIQRLFGDSAVSIHSKIKAKQRKQNLKEYNEGKVDRVIAAKALNEGVNLTNTEFAIILSANASIKDFLQRIGRCIRIVEGKRAIIIRLYLANSRDSYWMHMSQVQHTAINVNSLSELFQLIREYQQP